MKKFSEHLEEGTKPADSNAMHDSDGNMMDLADDSVVERLNAFLGTLANMEYMIPEHMVNVLRRKLEGLGISFGDVEFVGEEGEVSVPLTQFGGRFGKDLDTPYDEVINDDGISHKVEGGRELQFKFMRLENGTHRVFPKIV